MTDPSYGQLFPGTALSGKNAEMEMETAHGGFRFATSVGGTLLGRGGNFIIIDDPMKPDEAASQTSRDRTWEWYCTTVGSRLDNKAEDAMVVVMQRLDVDDLVGRLLDAGGWHHLSIPAIAEDEQDLAIGGERIIRRRRGDIIDPTREPREVLDRIRAEMGSRMFEAQYQQNPVPSEGRIANWSWFASYDGNPTREGRDWVVISWDTATKDREVNDYTVGIVALMKPNRRVYVLDVIRERLNFPELRTRVVAEAQRRSAMTLIEAAGSGIPLIQEVQGRIGVIPRTPIGEKAVRLQAVTPMIEAGEVHLPARAPWLDAFKRELLGFPGGRYDDQVDAFSQLLGWVKDGTGRVPLQGYYGYNV